MRKGGGRFVGEDGFLEGSEDEGSTKRHAY